MTYHNSIETCIQTLGQTQDAQQSLPLLRRIKNQVIGNDGEKSRAFQAGLLPVLVAVWQQDSCVQLQVIHILASLAQGGPAFVPPIRESRIVLQLCSVLPSNAQLSHTILQTLVDLARASSLVLSDSFDGDLEHVTAICTSLQIYLSAVHDLPASILVAKLLYSFAGWTRCAESVKTSIFCSFVRVLNEVILFEQGQTNVAEEGLGWTLAVLAIILQSSSSAMTMLELLILNPKMQDRFSLSLLLSLVIDLARSAHAAVRLGAAWLLATISRLQTFQESTAYAISMLVIPRLVQDISDIDERASYAFTDEAPTILGSLIAHEFACQQAAVDAGVIRVLTTLVKRGMANHPKFSGDTDRGKLSAVGLSTETMRFEKLRDGSLLALVALALSRENFRKQVLAAGVLPSIVRVLEYGREACLRSVEGPAHQNSTLIACLAIRAFARSASCVRASLSEVNIVKPICALVHCSDSMLQVEATAVISNLVLNTSPLREAVLKENIVEHLCTNARSENLLLCCESLWAIKHLLVNAATALKLECITKLGALWLCQLISLDGTSKSATDGHVKADEEINGHGGEPISPVAKAIIVREGLELIRNLILGSDTSRMINYILVEFGQERFFGILERVFAPDYQFPDAQIHEGVIKAACYVMVHIAASNPAHRQILVEQQRLMELFVPLFRHDNGEIRACCAWSVINITWEEDQADRTACRERSRVLDQLGVRQFLEVMQDDVDLNCRERARNALQSMSSKLDETPMRDD